MNNEIKAGDVVKLKSGGLPMTVSRIEKDYATCVFWVPTVGVFDSDSFSPDALVHTDDRTKVE